jgi:hypothetical protein
MSNLPNGARRQFATLAQTRGASGAIDGAWVVTQFRPEKAVNGPFDLFDPHQLASLGPPDTVEHAEGLAAIR